MMWHERQKLVCFERSKCSERPQTPHRTGNARKATNASTLPSMDAVMEGCTKITTSSAIVVPNKTKRTVSGLGIVEPLSYSFRSRFISRELLHNLRRGHTRS